MTKYDSGYLRMALVFLFAIVFVGSYTYSFYEGYTFWQSLFYIILTVTTVGAYAYHPATIEGEVITVAVVILGMGIVLFVASMFAKRIIEGERGFKSSFVKKFRAAFTKRIK